MAKTQNKAQKCGKKILFATSEAMPFIRTGGLGDVAGALPKSLNGLGYDCRVIMPLYGGISGEFRQTMESSAAGCMDISTTGSALPFSAKRYSKARR